MDISRGCHSAYHTKYFQVPCRLRLCLGIETLEMVLINLLGKKKKKNVGEELSKASRMGSVDRKGGFSLTRNH